MHKGTSEQINADYQSTYSQQFELARSLKRHHHFYLGPTNSGKTHHALMALEKAGSGIYLAPLRLLAT